MERRNIVCETSRLILRHFTRDDLAPLAAMHLDVEVARFIGGVKTLEQTRERLERWLAEYERYGFSKWAVVLRGGEELIGRCGLSPEQIDGVDEWELGWTFARRFAVSRERSHAHWPDRYWARISADCGRSPETTSTESGP